jgi:tetratricopeptide (TPR) repeat protein
MLQRHSFWVWLLALISVLAAGCGGLSAHNHRAREESRAAIRKRSSATGWPMEKLAEAHAHYAAGVIHEMEGDTEAALQEYYQAALNDPADTALVLEVARRFGQNKQPEKAVEVLSRAAAQPDASGAVFSRLGFLYAQLGKFDQAIAANRAAICKSPDSLVGYQNLFLNYLQTKQPPAALKVLDEAAQRPDASLEFLLGLAELYTSFSLKNPAQKAGVKVKALAVLNRAEKLKPSGTAQRVQLAESFNSLGEMAKAAQLYLDLLKKLPDRTSLRDQIHARLTEIYLRGQDHKRAVGQLEAILRDDPTNPQAHYFLGTIAYADKKPAEAVEHLSKTILLSKDFEQAYYDLALAQISLNKTSDALATLGRARERFTQNFVLELLSAMAFSAQKAYPEALQHYTAAEVIAKATDSKRLNEEFYFQVGATCERKGDYAEAERNFEKSLQLAPNFAEALNYLGYMWAERGTNLDKARGLIEKALKVEPKNAAYLDSLGWVLFKLSQPKEALPYVLKAAELSEKPDATVCDHLGDIYAALHEMEKARESWHKSLSLEANEEVRKKLEASEAK